MADARPTAQRVADTRARLHSTVDSWVATAGSDGPWCVPLTHVWTEGRLVYATGDDTRTVENLRADPRVRVCIGPTREVIILDGTAEVAGIDTMTDVEAHGIGGDVHPNEWATAVIRVTPRRVQAWREENEIADRTIMRDGEWLA